jgi:uncharacterized protein with GYD domain
MYPVLGRSRCSFIRHTAERVAIPIVVAEHRRYPVQCVETLLMLSKLKGWPMNGTGEEHMPRFLALLQYTTEGSKVLLKEKVTVRETFARKAIESVGGKVESIYFTASGEYHIAMTAEYPDAATAAAVIALMVSTGAVSKFNLIELITTSEIDRAYAALTDPVASGS